jgi:hypothetical protein
MNFGKPHMECGRIFCLSVLSAKSKKTLAQPPKSRKEATILNSVREPYEISPRFYRALQAKALSLENDARQDEAFAVTLENPDHLQRQNLLIDTQRDQAKRLRDFLAASRIRIG